jgi:hypothetical protein
MATDGNPMLYQWHELTQKQKRYIVVRFEQQRLENTAADTVIATLAGDYDRALRLVGELKVLIRHARPK